jgi:hypothetical protein
LALISTPATAECAVMRGSAEALEGPRHMS